MNTQFSWTTRSISLLLIEAHIFTIMPGFGYAAAALERCTSRGTRLRAVR